MRFKGRTGNFCSEAMYAGVQEMRACVIVYSCLLRRIRAVCVQATAPAANDHPPTARPFFGAIAAQRSCSSKKPIDKLLRPTLAVLLELQAQHAPC